MTKSKFINTALFIFGILVLTIFQVSFLNNLLGSWSPDLIVLVTMLLFFSEGKTPVLWFAFWASLFLDLVQASPFGVRGLILILLLILIQWLRSVASPSWVLRLFIYAVFSSTFSFALFVVSGFFGNSILVEFPASYFVNLNSSSLFFNSVLVELVLFAAFSRVFLLLSHSFMGSSSNTLGLRRYK